MSLVEGFAHNLGERGVRRGDRLGLAVSGGADSTALLHLAVRAAPRLGLRLHVLHVDHALRPGSGSDAGHVARLARSLHVPWSIVRSPVVRLSRQSVEAAARDVRYRIIDTAATELELTYVATAHTLDDQAETVVLRLLRGTGVSGLAGILPARGRVIRPLLGFRRAEIRAWLRDNGLGWIDDPTNADVALERNWVRHELFPALERRRSGAAVTIARLATLAAEDAAALDEIALRTFDMLASRRASGAIELPAQALAGPAAIRKRVIRRALHAVGGRVEARTIDLVSALADKAPGATVECGHRTFVRTTPGGLVFVPDLGDVPQPVALPAPGTVTARDWGICVRVGPGQDAEPWQWRCTLEARDSGSLWIRSRRPGDRVVTQAGTRKVQDVLVDAKVPRYERDRIPILAVGDRAVAVVGLTTPPLADGAIAVDVQPSCADGADGAGGADAVDVQRSGAAGE